MPPLPGAIAIVSELVIILALILANGVFSGAEIAIVALRKTRLQELLDSRRRGARAVLELKEHPEEFLATVQVGITVVSATAAAFGGASLANRLSPVFTRIDVLAPYAHELALALVIAAVSYLSIVLGELVPKSLALRGAEHYALLIGAPLRAVSWFARPLVWLLTMSSNLVLRPFGDRTTFTEARHSAEELHQLVEEATAAGTLHPSAGEIATRALELPELAVADVMVPRHAVVAIPRHAPPGELQRLLLENTHSRMPVFERRIDNVVGYVSVKDLLALAWEQRLIVLEDVMRPAYFVPESQRAVDLLQEMRRRHTPFAVVVDEAGGMAGIVTMEDLLEELVGEIFSEHELEEPHPIVKEAEGVYLIDAATPVREVNRALDLELPEEGDWTSIAGLILELVGRIPVTGELHALPNGVKVEIVDATARRVRKIRVRIERPVSPDEDGR